MASMVWPTMGRFTSKDLFVVVLFLCRTIVCDSQCPKFAEKPLETRVQDASIVFRAVVVQTHYQVSVPLNIYYNSFQQDFFNSS